MCREGICVPEEKGVGGLGEDVKARLRRINREGCRLGVGFTF